MNAFCTENEFGVKCNTSANISTWGNDHNDLVDPFEIPEEFAEELIQFHRYPPAWWVGQLIRFFARETDEFKEIWQLRMKTMGIESPIVG